MRRTLLLLMLPVVGCDSFRTTWYRGNTHAHTVICGHADSTPEDVARWYLDRDYHFLVLSEHNHFIDPNDVALPEDRREDFILIPGEEVTGRKIVHTTAMNIDGLVDWTFDHEHVSHIVQNHVDGTIDAGGVPILNHPNFHYAVSAEDMLAVDRLHLFELHNGHPDVANEGDETHPSTEEMWDTMLTAGMVIYAVASDDAHHFQTWGVQHSNPGRGWLMVAADELTPDAVTAAIHRGDFYASSGVMLSRVNRGAERCEVRVNRGATRRALRSELVVGRPVGAPAGRASVPVDEGFLIEWIGPGGAVLAAERSTRSSFAISTEHAYIRARVTYTRMTPTGAESFYAWTQPVFTDGRAMPEGPQR